ncbi:MAG: hypothetical protein HXY40_08565 [Chloroflexi bacterium]|nr:hypothetical protein [Chloroflexota bacterium]
MTLTRQGAAVRSPAHLRWLQDAGQLLVVDEKARRAHVLRGHEAALWTWFTLGYSYDKALHLLAAALKCPPAQAEAALRELLHSWQTLGLLEEARDGESGD